MLVQLTNQGAALLNQNKGPIQLSSFQVGSAFNYPPKSSDTGLHGTSLFTGTPTPYGVVNANVVKYTAILDTTVGTFGFGEVGLYSSDGNLFALATSPVLINKEASVNGAAGNSIRIDIYLSMVGDNYQMWMDVAQSNNPFRVATLNSVDQLPPTADAVPNVYIVSGLTPSQMAFQAYTDRQGLWNFDVYQYDLQKEVTITGFSSTSVSIDISDYVSGLTPAYVGELILQFSTGQAYSICRNITNTVVGATQATLSFSTPLALTPVVGDKILLFSRQIQSTTVANLPVATATVLGAIKVGNSLSITTDGVLNINPTSFPVTSVNGLTGDVVLDATNITGFAKVAYTGKYSDLSGAPLSYVLPVASLTRLGGVKADPTGNITIAQDGTLAINFVIVKSVNGVLPNGAGNIQLPADIGWVNPAQITTGSDLNTYLSTGLFYVANDGDAQSLLNGPGLVASRTAGMLEVLSSSTTVSGGDYVIQRWNDTNYQYYRKYTKVGATWSSWVQLTPAAGMAIASKTSLGGVIVGSGLNVDTNGLISTAIKSVNGVSTGDITLTAANVGALPNSVLDQFSGVPSLTSPVLDPTTHPVATDIDGYTFGRVKFYDLTLGALYEAGYWDANANHVIQSNLSPASPVPTQSTTYDANTSLNTGGLHTIDISSGGRNPRVPTGVDYQQVLAEGAVYRVTVAGTTNLDGYNQWDVDDLAVCILGKWVKVTINFTNVIFSAGTF